MPRCVYHNLHLAITRKSVMLTPDEKAELVTVRREKKLLPRTPEEIAKRQKLNDAAAQRQRDCRQRKRAMMTPEEKAELVTVRREKKLLPQTPEEIAKRQKLNDAAAHKQRNWRQRKRAMMTPEETAELVTVRREKKLYHKHPKRLPSVKNSMTQLHKDNVIVGNENVP